MKRARHEIMRKAFIYLFSMTFLFHFLRPLFYTREVVDFINRRGGPWLSPVPCPTLSANAELFLLLCCV